MTNPVELKVKSKALAEEAQIIRKEEHKAKKDYRYHRDRQNEREAKAANFRLHNLADHRKGIVRQVAHDTFVARAFLAGRPYSDHAPTRHDRAYTSWYSVRNMVRKYGGFDFSIMTNDEIDEKLQAWRILTEKH